MSTKLKKLLQENIDGLSKIEPKIAFKIYKALAKEFPEIGRKFTESSFYYFLDKNL